MNLSFLDSLRPYVSRVIGGLVAAGAALLSTKTGITLTPEQQQAITVGAATAAFGVTHKIVDKFVNPGDTASTHLAVQSATDADSLKH